MAKQNFSHFVKRNQPKKRGPGQHKKSQSKHEKRQKNQNRYLGQGKKSCLPWQKATANKRCEKRSPEYIKKIILAILILLLYLPIY